MFSHRVAGENVKVGQGLVGFFKCETGEISKKRIQDTLKYPSSYSGSKFLNSIKIFASDRKSVRNVC